MMMLPMVRYLHLQATSKWPRRIALATLCLLPVTILGSHSRGALLALSAGGLFLWLRGEKKMLGAVLIVGGAVLAVVLMPAAYWSRMETIETYNQDTSAMTRINAWWCAFNVAKTHVFGGGFDYYTWDVIARYAPDPTSLQGPHSIYFQIMGEHGFIGLFLFLGIGASTWFTCAAMRREARGRPDLKWVGDLGSMIQVSMIGFAVGGAFLGLAYFDLPYYLMVAAVVGLHVARRQPAPAATVAAPPPAPTLRRGLSR
jgi:putative inorganic carbon (hco3(-)) transporter